MKSILNLKYIDKEFKIDGMSIMNRLMGILRCCDEIDADLYIYRRIKFR